jgi:exonuclease III
MVKPTLKELSDTMNPSKGSENLRVVSTKEWSSHVKSRNFGSLLGKESSKKSADVALQIYHQNIQGLRSKIDEILNFLHPEFPHILCLSEHHFNQMELETVQLGHYTLGASYCRRSKKKGGVCIFVHRDLKFSNFDLSNISIKQHLEACAILLSNSSDSVYIISIYRVPSGNFILFLKKLETILNFFFRNNTKMVLCGDINVNYLSDNEKKKRNWTCYWLRTT